MLDRVCAGVADVLAIPSSHAWAMWHMVPRACVSDTMWNSGFASSPTVLVHCRDSYPREAVRALLHVVRDEIAAGTGCDPASIFITVRRVHPYELHVRGAVWEGT
jgi:hypothetical protein